MTAIRATWINGQIVPSEPVNWPEGSQLWVEPIVSPSEKIGMTEEEWHAGPEAIAAWAKVVEALEPMVWAEGESEALERYREQCRRFNLEAVRKQMEAQADGDIP